MEYSRHRTGKDLKIDIVRLISSLCAYVQIAVTVFVLIVTTIYTFMTASKDVDAPPELAKGVPAESKLVLTKNAEDELKDQESATP